MPGTIVPDPDFNAVEDCETLKRAMKGLGTDEEAIINIIGNRSLDQRLDIADTFKKKYGKSLHTMFNSELSSNFRNLCKSLILPLPHLLAKEAKRAINTSTTQALAEILTGLTNSDVDELKLFYRTKFGCNIERDIGGMTKASSSFKRLAVRMLQGARSESSTVDTELAEVDAQNLFSAGINKFGTKDPVFNVLLSCRSSDHLKVVLAKYRVVAHEDIEESIRSGMAGEMQETYLSIVKEIRDPVGYFAEQLHNIMVGIGTDDEELIRIVVWRSEIDLAEVKGAFSTMNATTLEENITEDTSGDYMSLLLTIVK